MHIHWHPLTSSKNIWPKINVAYFAKWFQSIFTVRGWRMYLFNLPLLALAYIPAQSCKRALFWSLNPARTRNHKPEYGSRPTFIFEARFRPESQIYQGELRHRCRSRQIFGDAKDFCSNSHKLPRKLCASILKSKDVGRHFAHTFTEVCEGFQRFCPDFEGFCQEFHQIKTCNPVSYTSELRHAQLQSNKKRFVQV